MTYQLFYSYQFNPQIQAKFNEQSPFYHIGVIKITEIYSDFIG